MFRKYLISVGIIYLALPGFSQVTPKDTMPAMQDLAIDTSFNYDDLLDEMDDFLDSLLRSKSYFLASVASGSGFFNYSNRGNAKLETVRRSVHSAIIGYYHKKGPGLTLSGNMTKDREKLTFYQFSISPSFDFIQSLDWMGGISYQRYFTKDSLAFYTSPLQNEFNLYFSWRKSWLQPGFTASYGWGSRSALEKREKYIRLLRLIRLGYIVTSNTKEDISDFSVSASVRHNFYWMHIFDQKDYLKFTPLIAFSAGTQKFGFNRTISTYPVNIGRTGTPLYNSGDLSVDEKLKFQPLSLALYLRPEYNFGKFFVQPQLILDYYLPAENLSALFSINAGVFL